jgi:hypothetical protein
MEKGHRFPMPLWNNSGVTINLPKDLAEQLGRQNFQPKEIAYVPNQIILDRMNDMREAGRAVWTDKVLTTKFPMALHGPNGQSVSVNDERELKRGLANGWSQTPIVVNVDERFAPPSADRPPSQLITP